MIDRIIEASMTLMIGSLLLPAFKLILDQILENSVDTLPGLTDLEGVIMHSYPIGILLAFFAALIVAFRKGKDKE